jgi:uncharacterized membrane protein YhaH (DUF805 family)
MEFPEAIRLALRERIFDYRGRSRRAEYWWYWAFCLGVWFVLYFVFIGLLLTDAATGEPGALTVIGFVLYLLACLALMIPGLSLTVRRLHDLDRTGWWVVTAFIPFLNFVFGIILLIWCAQPGTEGSNRFGIDPKAHEIF